MTHARATDSSTALWLPLWIAVGAAAAMVGIDQLLKPPDLALTREHGGLEMASAFLYLWAAAVWVRLHGGRGLRRDWQVPLLLLMMGGRELDLDKSLTSVGLLKSRLYLSAEAPVWERLLGVVVLALLAVALVRLARRQGRGFLARLRSGSGPEVAVLGGLLLAAFAKTVDGLGRKLQGFGIELGAGTARQVGTAEEVLELFVPLLFLAAVLLGARRRRGPAPAEGP